MSDDRYLVNGQKQIELLEFERGRDLSPPDQEIEPYLLELNRLPGLCTLQSCSGHVEEDARDGTEYISCGNLWLWLSKAMTKRFYGTAFKLVQRPEIEKLSILFQGYGREIVSITFQGAGHGKLAVAMAIIIEFFKDCVVEEDDVRAHIRKTNN